jgi:transcriptional regulator with XRE-family HTH domain
MDEPLRVRIRKLRETLRLTQVQFADQVSKLMPGRNGPHPSTINRWENGSSVPSGDYLEALATLANQAGLRNLFTL